MVSQRGWSRVTCLFYNYHFTGDNFSEDFQRPIDLILEQCDAATCVAVSRLTNLESDRNDLVITSATVSRPNSIVARLRTKNYQFQGELNREKLELRSSQALQDELDLFWRGLADRDFESDRLHADLILVRGLMDGNLERLGDQF